MKIGIPGTVLKLSNRMGGYINYQYNCKNPEKNNPNYMLNEQEANQMLYDANIFIQKYFPWIEDFIVFQLNDNTIRLDAVDRQFLGE